MNLMMRRRALMQRGDNYVDPYPDYVRMIVKGHTDREVNLWNWGDPIVEAILDGVRISSMDYQFTDTNLHELYIKFRHIPNYAICSAAIVVDIPSSLVDFDKPRQTFKVGDNADVKERKHVILRHSEVLPIPDSVSLPYYTWGCNKNVNLYVPSKLIDDYNNAVNPNGVRYSVMNIVSLEDSVFKTRIPTDKLIKKLNIE